MHPLRKIVLARGLALALVSVALWQQQGSGAHASEAQGFDAWQAPLSAPLELINPYFQPNSDYSAGHRGVDYRVQLADPIFAPSESVVSFNGKVVNRQVLSIKTASGDLIEFEPACSPLPNGAKVIPGEEIAMVCQADRSYRSHCPGQLCLHFSLRTSDGYLSPLVRYGALAPTVLLPNDQALG